jgi:hypothetical protein
MGVWGCASHEGGNAPFTPLSHLSEKPCTLFKLTVYWGILDELPLAVGVADCAGEEFAPIVDAVER